MDKEGKSVATLQRALKVSVKKPVKAILGEEHWCEITGEQLNRF